MLCILRETEHDSGLGFIIRPGLVKLLTTLGFIFSPVVITITFVRSPRSPQFLQVSPSWKLNDSLHLGNYNLSWYNLLRNSRMIRSVTSSSRRKTNVSRWTLKVRLANQPWEFRVLFPSIRIAERNSRVEDFVVFKFLLQALNRWRPLKLIFMYSFHNICAVFSFFLSSRIFSTVKL